MAVLTIVSVSLLMAVATETLTSVIVVGTCVVSTSTSWIVSVRIWVAVTIRTECSMAVVVRCRVSVMSWQQAGP